MSILRFLKKVPDHEQETVSESPLRLVKLVATV